MSTCLICVDCVHCWLDFFNGNIKGICGELGDIAVSKSN